MSRLGKIAYTSLVAFITALLTLLAVYRLLPDQADQPADPEARLPRISPAELAAHDHAADCWKAIDGRVYDVTGYLPRHPTPPEVMLEWCGRDATEGWRDKGAGRPHSARAEAMLADYLVGVLATGPDRPRPRPLE